MDEMLQALGTYIKLAVDIRREILSGGGALHAEFAPARIILRLKSLIRQLESRWQRLLINY